MKGPQPLAAELGSFQSIRGRMADSLYEDLPPKSSQYGTLRPTNVHGRQNHLRIVARRTVSLPWLVGAGPKCCLADGPDHPLRGAIHLTVVSWGMVERTEGGRSRDKWLAKGDLHGKDVYLGRQESRLQGWRSPV